jgi:hypothetical protein
MQKFNKPHSRPQRSQLQALFQTFNQAGPIGVIDAWLKVEGPIGVIDTWLKVEGPIGVIDIIYLIHL